MFWGASGMVLDPSQMSSSQAFTRDAWVYVTVQSSVAPFHLKVHWDKDQHSRLE